MIVQRPALATDLSYLAAYRLQFCLVIHLKPDNHLTHSTKSVA